MTVVILSLEVCSSADEHLEQAVGEGLGAVGGGRPAVRLIVTVATALSAVLSLGGRARANGVQQRLAGAVARGGVEIAVQLNQAQQSRSMVRKAGRVERAVDAVEALQKGRI